MNKQREQQILDYYSTTDKYIRSKTHSKGKAETCAELTAILYTRDKAVMRKPDTLAANFHAAYKLTGRDEISKTYSFPKSYVSYRKPRAVSTEQRERARQMMIGQNRAIGRKDYPEN